MKVPPPASGGRSPAYAAVRSGRRPTRRLFGALAIAVVVAGACGGGDGGGSAAPVELVAADVDRATPATNAPVDQVVAGLEAFARDVEPMLAADPDNASGNTVFSPTSIGVAFAMTQAGARGETEQQIAEVFGFPDQQRLHEAMNALTAQLGDVNDDDVALEVANSIWGQQGFDFESPFLEVLARHYGAEMHVTDFMADPEAGRGEINAWVAEATHERIPELVPSGAITRDTRVALVNAIYMKSAWAEPFLELATYDDTFHLAEGTTVEVPMMHSTLDVRAVDGDHYVAAQLPYAGQDLAMLVIVPDDGVALDQVLHDLGDTPFTTVAEQLHPASVATTLPRWDIEGALDLAGVLTELGLPLPGGDMSGIGPGLEIAAAVHAADITVDEQGTEAAAATAVIIEATSAPVPAEPVELTADRPFAFAVRHVETGAPLFVGRVADPRG